MSINKDKLANFNISIQQVHQNPSDNFLEFFRFVFRNGDEITSPSRRIDLGQRWPEAVMHSWGSYFVP